jgi:hypothetical protein
MEATMASTPTTSRRDLLAPVETVMSLIVTLCVSLVALGVVLAVVSAFTDDSDWSLGEPCAVVHENAITDRGGMTGAVVDSAPTDVGPSDPERSAGVATYDPDGVEVCLQDPTWWQAAAGYAVRYIGFLELAVAIFLLRRVVRTARRNGLFVPATVGEIRRLGRVLLAFVVLGPLVTVVGTWVVVAPTEVSVDLPGLLVLVGVPWVLLLVAAGVVTVARVLDHAAELQDDADHTV